MNPAHIHLLLNHFPIIGSVVGILILVVGFIMKNTTVKRVALFVFIGTALFCIPAYLTGEGAEEAVEHIQGVTESTIEAHEDAAKLGLIVTLVLGGVSALALFASLKERVFANMATFVVLAVAVANMGVMYHVGNSGGLIRHSEIAGLQAQIGGQGSSEQEKQPGTAKQGADTTQGKGGDNDSDDD